MKFVIQRVQNASVQIEGQVKGAIEKGLLVFIGIAQDDTLEIADKMVRKLINMRIFEDQEGKTNLALQSVGGELLLVSQFTLYANCKKGNRPSFIDAGRPEIAIPLYEHIIETCKAQVQTVETGEFGADMQVALVNDGPFTIVLDSETL